MLTLSEYFQKLVSDILICDGVTCTHYGILAQLSYIDPLLIEKNISNILSKVLMEEQSAEYTRNFSFLSRTILSVQLRPPVSTLPILLT